MRLVSDIEIKYRLKCLFIQFAYLLLKFLSIIYIFYLNTQVIKKEN